MHKQNFLLILGLILGILSFSCKNEPQKRSNKVIAQDSLLMQLSANTGDTICYSGLIPFRKGLLWGFYSPKKGFISEIIYDDFRMFDEFGRAEVSLNGKWGVIDTLGNYFIKPLYDRISSFINGLYMASKMDTSYIFNYKGKILSSFIDQYEYTGMEWLNDSLMPVKKYNKWNLLDIRNGKIHYHIPYNWVSFYHGYLSVGDEKYGTIDQNGNIIIPIIYNKPLAFNNGLSVIEKDGKAGYINEKGEIVVPLKYEPFTFEDCSTSPDGTLEFSGGVGRVQLKGKYGYVNTKGREITRIEYDYAQPFRYGMGVVEKKGFYSAIDTSGKTLIEFMKWDDFILKFEYIRKINYPDYNIDYGKIQKEKYNYIVQIRNGLFMVEIDGKRGYVDKNGIEYFE
ncbi:MAG TPA: WG repeat-containing protein [Bacteroidales bacterium]|nr:WG repeat-containing protein [Bacteroidales bacterium]